jgi:hypothetical protein
MSFAIEMDVLVKSHSIHSKGYPEDPTVHTEINENSALYLRNACRPVARCLQVSDCHQKTGISKQCQTPLSLKGCQISVDPFAYDWEKLTGQGSPRCNWW